jgi:hypothetical protein
MTTATNKLYAENQVKATEVWYQDAEDSDLWFGEHGVIVNTAALAEREFYYEVIRVPHHPTYVTQDKGIHA